MDEVDSIGSARSESGGGGGGGDSEVQRTMLELLNQLDGFEATNKIKARPQRGILWQIRAPGALCARRGRETAGCGFWWHSNLQHTSRVLQLDLQISGGKGFGRAWTSTKRAAAPCYKRSIQRACLH